MQISLSSVALNSLLPNSVIILKENKLSASCQYPSIPVPCHKYGSNVRQQIVISVPVNPISPNIILMMPSRIFSCDQLKIDPTASFGSGGRSWSSVQWSVSRVDGSNTASLEAYLNSFFPSTSALVIIPSNTTLISPGDYTFSLKLQNVFGKSSMISKSIQIIEEADLPQVSIIGLSAINTYRHNKLQIAAQGSVTVCGRIMDDGLLFSWKVFQGVQIDESIKSTSLDQRFFKLSEFTLEANTKYFIKLTVSLSKNPILSTSTVVTVNVGISGVKAQIRGGSIRTQLNTKPLVLDASESYDIDYPSSPDRLAYSWSCQEYSPNYGTECPIGFNLLYQSLNKIEAGSIDITRPTSYLIGVTVQNSFGIFDSYETIINIIKDAVPTVTLNNINNKLNSKSKITITGLVTVPLGQTANAMWGSPDLKDDELESAVLTPVSGAFLSNSTSIFQLTLEAVFLIPGSIYTFTLTASRDNFPLESSFATLSIEINKPPMGGYLSVSPLEGTSLETFFTLFTISWSDDASDYPLSFAFDYYSNNPDYVTKIKPFSEGTSASSMLGQGLESMNYAVTCVSTAMDVWGDINNAETIVQVKPAVKNIAQLSTVLSDTVSAALKSADVDSITLVLSAATSSLNTVDCSSSPNCMMLNRNNCSLVINTCGACLEGFFGVLGPSNVVCIRNRNKNPRRRLHEHSFDNNYPALTSLESKVCPNGCSGHGRCQYSNYYDDPIDTCLQTTFTCQARCVCKSGWDASDCSISSNNITEIQALRESLCATLYLTLNMQDLTPELITERANKVTNILVDPLQITKQGLTNCTDFLLKTIAKDYSMSSLVISSVYSSLSAILSADYYGMLPDNMLTRIISAIKMVSLHRQDYLSVGESDPSFFDPNGNDYFRVKVLNEYYMSIKSKEILSPQSPLETFNDVVPVINSMQSSVISTDNRLNPVGLSLIEFSRKVFDFQFENSSHVNLIYNLQSGPSINLYPDLVSYTTLPNRFVYNNSNYTQSGNVYCDASENPYSVVIGCPHEINETIRCDGNPGKVAYNCSRAYIEPTCSNTNSQSKDWFACSAETFSDSNITCKCSSILKSALVSQVDILVGTHLVNKMTVFGSSFAIMPLVKTSVSLVLSGLSKSEFENSMILKTAIRSAVSETLGISLNSISEEIILSTKLRIEANSVNVKLTITSVLTSNAISSILSNSVSSTTTSFINTALGITKLLALIKIHLY